MALRHPSAVHLATDAQNKRASKGLGASTIDATASSGIPPVIEYVPARATRKFEKKLSAIRGLMPDLKIE